MEKRSAVVLSFQEYLVKKAPLKKKHDKKAVRWSDMSEEARKESLAARKNDD